eukprot:gene26977-7673_t
MPKTLRNRKLEQPAAAPASSPAPASAPKASAPSTTKPARAKCCSFSCCGKALVVAVALLTAFYFSIPYLPIPNADLAASSSAEPIVIYCERTVKDAAKYAAAWSEYAEGVQANRPGVRAMFSFMSKDDATKALQFSFFDGPQDIPGDPNADLYAGTTADGKADVCIVYGGWTDDLKVAMSAVPGVHYAFEEKLGGFIRNPDAEGFAMEGPIMVFISKRVVKPGMRDEVYSKVFQRITDIMYPVAPGLIAAFEIKAEDDPDMVWSLRIFSDYRKGFLAHIYGSVFLAPTIALTMVPLWGGTPGVFPTANSFSTQADITGAIAGFPANAVYDQYTYPPIGPMPDFKKGTTTTKE